VGIEPTRTSRTGGAPFAFPETIICSLVVIFYNVLIKKGIIFLKNPSVFLIKEFLSVPDTFMGGAWVWEQCIARAERIERDEAA